MYQIIQWSIVLYNIVAWSLRILFLFFYANLVQVTNIYRIISQYYRLYRFVLRPREVMGLTFFFFFSANLLRISQFKIKRAIKPYARTSVFSGNCAHHFTVSELQRLAATIGNINEIKLCIYIYVCRVIQILRHKNHGENS